MLMKVRRASDPAPSEITPPDIFHARRSFMRAAAVAGAGAVIGGFAPGRTARAGGTPLKGVVKSPHGTDEKQTPYDDVTSYNNFYEFGTAKTDPARHAGSLKTRPWSIQVGGKVATSRVSSTSRRCCLPSPWRNASTACAASRRGPWWCRGWACRWRR